MINITFRKLAVLVFIIISFTAYSCAIKTHTKTIIPLSESNRSGLKKVAIFVQSDEELNVNLTKLKDRYWTAMLEGCGGCNSIGCIFLPVVIAAAAVIEESVRSGMDHSKEREFREGLSNLNLNVLLSESIEKAFESSDAGFEAEIIEIRDSEELAQKGYDSILDITLKKIEVNLSPRLVVHGYINQKEAAKGIGPYCTEEVEIEEVISEWNSIFPEYDKKLQTNAAHTYLSSPHTIKKSKEEIERSEIFDKEISELKSTVEEYASSDQFRLWLAFQGKITSTRDNKALWEREEVYYDPKCERVKDIQANPEIIVDMVTRSISNMAVNTVVQILY
jgi:hypothetical protein